MTDRELDEINRKRREQGKPPLNRGDILRARQEAGRADDPGFDFTGFLIGYTTGIPIGSQGITGAALVGSLLHSSSPAAAEPEPQRTHESGYTHSPSYDSGSSSSSSSSSYDSSSSSSYDSGSSSSSGGDAF